MVYAAKGQIQRRRLVSPTSGQAWSSKFAIRFLCSQVWVDSDVRQTNAPGGHFIKEDLAAFDAHFFNITAAEAAVSILSLFEWHRNILYCRVGLV